LLTGTSLLFGKFKIREGIEIKIKSHFWHFTEQSNCIENS
jgi:hypothetical protein